MIRLCVLLLIASFLSRCAYFTKENKLSSGESKTFTVYFSKSPHPRYSNDSDWKAFVKTGSLDEVAFTGDDIEAYDWSNQVFTLKTKKQFEERPGGLAFIAVLGEQRLFGGEMLRPISAMAIAHPVIYSSVIEGKSVLVLRSSHDFVSGLKAPDLQNAGWKEIASPELRAYFAENKKLRDPGDKDVFQKFRDSMGMVKK